MTASLVSSQGFTYKMTRVTLSNCLISGVHLKSCRQAFRMAVSLLFATKLVKGGWGCKKVY